MKQIRIGRYALVHAIIVFSTMNFCLSLLSFIISDYTNYFSFIIIITGFTDGIALGILSIFYQKKWGKFINYWQRFFTFCLVFVAMLIIGTLLFHISMYYDPIESPVVYSMFYWLPQQALVLYMIPGAVVYYLIEYIYHKVGKGDMFGE